MFSCELYEIFKNTFSPEHILTTASDYSQNLQQNMNDGVLIGTYIYIIPLAGGFCNIIWNSLIVTL